MTKWAIYSKDGTPKHESLTEYNSDGRIVWQDTFEYSGKWMGECFLTVSIKSAYPIDFQIGDYIDYRGERFTVNYAPTVIKKARRGTYGEGFTYDSIKFNSRSNELTEMMFHDWVLSDNQLHYTSLPNFSFYCKDVDDLADRLQANSDRWCKANGFAKEDYWVFYTLKNNTTSGTSDTGQTPTAYDRTVQRARDISTDEAFLAGIQAKWLEIYGEGEKYADSRDNERYDRTITASSQTVWDMMSAVKQQFGLNFIIRGRNVYIGTAGVVADHLFKYGKGNGLYEVDKTADQDQKVVTKLHAYGSDENLPTRYYADLNKIPGCKVKAITNVSATDDTPSAYFSTDLPFDGKYFRNEGTDATRGLEYFVAVKISGIEVRGVVTGQDGVMYFYTDANYDTADNVRAFAAQVAVDAIVYFTDGVQKSTFPSGYLYYETENLPDNMAVNYLMLPGFPNNSLADLCKAEYDSASGTTKYYIRKTASSGYVLFHTESGNHVVRFSDDQYNPYILSPNADSLGVREGDVFCNEENDDNGLKKVYPTIEEMTASDAGIGDGDTRLDAVVKADTVEDNGVYPNDKSGNVPGFNIYIPKLGFGLDDAVSDAGGSEAKISMKNGYCGGRTFDIANVEEQDDGSWKLNCRRVHDDDLDLYFPYSYGASVHETSVSADAYQILAGDNYVLTGIAVSDANYVWAASVRLLRKAIHWLCKNDYTRYVYTPKIDDIYMARQDAEAKADTTGAAVSLHETLKEGDMLLFADGDLGLNGAVYIDRLNIRENGNNGIPTYEVTLRNEVQVGTLQRIQNTVDSLRTDIEHGSAAGVVSPTQIEPLVEAYGRKYFLSRTHSDTASGRITLAGGAEVKNGLKADGIENDGNITNAGDIRTHNLYVTGTAHFSELSIDRVTASGGAHLYSAADGFTIIRADAEYDESDETKVVSYKLYWLAQDDDGRGIMNMWKQYDQALCMSFNPAGAVSEDGTHDISNKYWWALVTGVSGNATETVEIDGVERVCNWITVSATDKEEKCTVNPEAGDEVVQLGYRGTLDEARKSAILDSAYANTLDGELEPPFRAYYRGIDSFDLPSHRYSYFDARSAVLRGVSITQLKDTALHMEVDSSLGLTLDTGTTTTLTCTVLDAMGNDVTSTIGKWEISRDSGDSEADAAWLETDKVKAFNALPKTADVAIDLSYGNADDSDIPAGRVAKTSFTIKAYDAEGVSIPSGKARKSRHVIVARTGGDSASTDDLASLKQQVDGLAARIEEVAYIEANRIKTKS